MSYEERHNLEHIKRNTRIITTGNIIQTKSQTEETVAHQLQGHYTNISDIHYE